MSTRLGDRATASRAWNAKVRGVVNMGLVFLCGAAAGALAMNLGVHKVMHQPAFDTPEGKVRFFERLQKQLDLTPAQSEQIQSVLNDFWQYYRSVLSDSKSRVEQILTPPQRQKFERMLQESQR